jgi:hypothetical protein
LYQSHRLYKVLRLKASVRQDGPVKKLITGARHPGGVEQPLERRALVALSRCYHDRERVTLPGVPFEDEEDANHVLKSSNR